MVDTTKLFLIGAAVLLVIGTALGAMVGGAGRQVLALLDPDLRAAVAQSEAARVEAEGAWAAAQVHVSNAVNFVLTLAAVGGGLWFAYAGGKILLHRAEVWSMTIRPQHGTAPLFVDREGRVLYPDREIVGDRDITQRFIRVQSNAAWQSDKLSINLRPAPAREALAMEEGNADPEALPDLVRAADVIHSPTLERLTLGIGAGGPVEMSVHRMMHTLAVGASGFGKSAFLRLLIWQLAQVPEPVRVAAVDLYGSELNLIDGWARLMFPVAHTEGEARAVLTGLTSEVDRRRELYAQQPLAVDLVDYNHRAADALAPVVALVDEGTAMLANSDLGQPLARLVQTSRQFGVYVVLSGQSVKSTVLDTATRDNFSTRLAYYTSPTSYRVVLDETIREQPKPGRAWARLVGQPLQPLQTPFVTREQVAQLIERGSAALTFPAVEAARDGERDQIAALHRQGLSITAIARAVYGVDGGGPWYKVKDTIENLDA